MHRAAARRPRVGVFDSGVGGLTVLRALRERAPGLDYLYLGDTARVPYGTRSAATVSRYALTCAGELAQGLGAEARTRRAVDDVARGQDGPQNKVD